jgi:hypothetical protein
MVKPAKTNLLRTFWELQDPPYLVSPSLEHGCLSN